MTASDADTVGTLSDWQITDVVDAGGNTVAGAVFTIDATSGQITVADGSALDHESNAQYTLTVQVEDGSNTSASETVQIDLTDLNDTAPVIGAGQVFTVDENAANTTVVGTVTASDADTVGTLTNWQITAGNDDGVFTIDATSGQITVADGSALDHEGNAQYTLTVQVEDGSNTSASETVRIDLTDLNDTAPVIGAGQVFTVDENAANATVVGTVTASDADTVGTLSDWQITAGNDDGAFTIDGSNGQITVVDGSVLDHEGNAQYTLTVQVEDGTNTAASETVRIDLTDLNDTAPVIGAGQVFAVDENAANTTVVGTVTASDADTVGTLTDWQITNLADAGGNTVAGAVFTIDATSGQITVADGSALDHESSNAQYTLTVQVEDGTNTSASETVRIDLTDLNDTAPVIAPNQSFALDENAGNGTVVGTVTASDADTVGTLTNWQITAGNDDGAFTIDATSGQITVVDGSVLDHEGNAQYTLTVQVEDGTNASASETVRIDLTDLNDTAPVIAPNQVLRTSTRTRRTRPWWER